MAIYFTNAQVYTGQGGFDPKATLAIQGGKIRSVGTGAVPKAAKRTALPLLHEAYQAWLKGPFTPVGKRPFAPDLGDLVIDCTGARIYPGLLDPHTHIAVSRTARGRSASTATSTPTPTRRT